MTTSEDRQHASKLRQRLTWWATALLIAAGAAALAMGVVATPVGRDIEARTWDWRVRLWTPDRPPTDAVILEIDEGSLRWLSRHEKVPWPLPRDVWCRILGELKAAGAKAVVFDVLFSEISEFDEPFAACIGDHGAVALAWQCMGDEAVPPPRWRVDGHGAIALPQRTCKPVVPVDAIGAAAAFGGRVEMEPDPDGVIRRGTPLLRFEAGAESYPALGLAAAMLVSHQTPTVADDELRFGSARLSLDSGGRVLLAWRRADDAVARVQLKQLYAASRQREEGLPVTFDARSVRDKVVFVAGTAAATYEYRVTPVAEGTPGVYAHIALYESLHGGTIARDAPAWADGVACAVVALLVTLAALGFSTPRAQLAGLLLVSTGWLAVTAVAYRHHGWWLALVAPQLGGLVAFAAGALTNYRWVGRERRLIRHAFAHYLSAEVIEQLVANPDALKLGGERRDITAFFSDIRGFTNLTEATEPAQLVELLNECLGALTTELLQHRGTIDKYVGDAIVAMFGAPLTDPDHPYNACRGALAVQERMARLRENWKLRGLPELHVRVGMSSGVALVGNMGSQQRFDYTMIGDMVNLAARLEGTAGTYGIGILISHAMAERVRDRFLVREIDAVRVKGKHIGVRIYELMADGDSATDAQRVLAEATERALGLYRSQRWAEALTVLEPLAAAGDGPATTLVQRIAVLRTKELDADWDGVYEFTSK
ncbi:MAG: adenylate/guanylate cyclase domain-containing protein [Deltaproteobacteria bacterium]|nr:adenylate/guanylate cyclase domain-containing protein [Deltaproteobacteria bacterium]